MSADDVAVRRGDRWERITLPEPDSYADLDAIEPGLAAPVWDLRVALFDDLGNWVRAASAACPVEIAGHDVDEDDLDAWQHDLLALLAAVRASRAAIGSTR